MTHEKKTGITVFANISGFSAVESLREGFYRTLTLQYLRVISAWFIVSLTLHLLNPLIAQIGSLFIMSAVSVAWYRSLAFQEEAPFLRFSKSELVYLFYTIFIGMTVLFLGLITSIITARLGMIGLSFGGLFLTGLFFWCMPFIFVFLGLVAMGFDGSSVLKDVKNIVLPIHFQLLIIYLSLIVLNTCVVVGLVFLIKDFGPTFLLEGVIMMLQFLFAGILNTFTSHIIYTRCSYEKPY